MEENTIAKKAAGNILKETTSKEVGSNVYDLIGCRLCSVNKSGKAHRELVINGTRFIFQCSVPPELIQEVACSQ